jgi:hypothetical protein
MREACDRHDLDAVRACHHADYEFDDRRSMAPTNNLRVRDVELIAKLFDLDDFSWKMELLATRGDRLVLMRDHIAFVHGAAGLAEVTWLGIREVDSDGLVVRAAAFEVDRTSEAYDELDRLYVEQGGPDLRPYRHAHASRDWDRYAAFFSPSLVFEDERSLGWGRLDLEGFLDHHRVEQELAPDEQMWIDHVVAHSERATLIVARSLGTNEGGAVEWPSVSLSERDAEQRIVNIRFYALEDLERALERFRQVS